MNVNDFYEYLANPHLLNKASLDELHEVIERYPYFQLARMLYLKNLYLLNDDRYQQTLEKYSIYFLDRKSLFEFIHDEINTDETPSTKVINASLIEQNDGFTNTSFETSETFINQPTLIETSSKSEIEQQSTKDTKVETNKVTDHIQETQQTESTENEQTETNISIADLILQKIESQKKSQENILKQITEEKTNDNKESLTPSHAFTFQDWLDQFSKREITANEPQQNTTDNLIDNFLQNIDQIERIKPPQEPNIENEDLTENLLSPEEMDIVSEQLAQLYYKQGHFDRALKMYEKLFLKYPEKSIYFASLIQEIKQKIDKN